MMMKDCVEEISLEPDPVKLEDKGEMLEEVIISNSNSLIK